MYQRVGAAALKKDLSKTIALCEKLKNPQNKFKSIHIAGTNGKGSCSHLIASVLQEAGYKTGLYTSPHLKDFRERIKINGQMITEEEVISFVENNKALFEKIGPSFFEMTVAMAFDYFARQKVDIAIIEAGLGGRLDSTNIITPLISVITNIGLDHQQMLGGTLEKIAKEKAGIIKENIPLVIGRKQRSVNHVFEKQALQKKCIMLYTSGVTPPETDLLGEYQKENTKTAYSTLQEVKNDGFIIEEAHIQTGFKAVVKNTGLQGRWQVLKKKPYTFCDVAHNEEGVRTVLKQLEAIAYQELHIVFGMVHDKKIEDILKLLPIKATYYFCQPNIPRGLDAGTLQKEANKLGLKGDVYASVNKARTAAEQSAKDEDLIYIGGSTFVVAEVV